MEIGGSGGRNQEREGREEKQIRDENSTRCKSLPSYQDLIDGGAALLKVNALDGHVVILLLTECLLYHAGCTLACNGGGAERCSVNSYHQAA